MFISVYRQLGTFKVVLKRENNRWWFIKHVGLCWEFLSEIKSIRKEMILDAFWFQVFWEKNIHWILLNDYVHVCSDTIFAFLIHPSRVKKCKKVKRSKTLKNSKKMLALTRLRITCNHKKEKDEIPLSVQLKKNPIFKTRILSY